MHTHSKSNGNELRRFLEIEEIVGFQGGGGGGKDGLETVIVINW